MNDSRINSNSKGELESSSPCLLQIGELPLPVQPLSHKIECVSAPILDCRPLPPSDAWPTAFNNISAQFLSRTVVSDNGALNCLSATPNYEIV